MVAISARVNIDPALRTVEGLRQFPKLYAENVARFGDQVAEREVQRLRLGAQVDSGAQRASIGWERTTRRRFLIGTRIAVGWRLGFGVARPLPLNESGRPYFQYTHAPIQTELAALRFRLGIQAAADAARVKALADIRRAFGG